jgi:hypothetical protein
MSVSGDAMHAFSECQANDNSIRFHAKNNCGFFLDQAFSEGEEAIVTQHNLWKSELKDCARLGGPYRHRSPTTNE